MGIRGHINRALEFFVLPTASNRLSIGVGVTISEYLDPELVVVLEETHRDKAIEVLVDALIEKKHLQNKDVFYQSVIEREKLVSTGVGVGVAIPHAKLEICPDFFIVVGIVSHKGIDWKTIDGSLVRLIFLVGGPANQQKKYLAILSELTSFIRDSSLREEILQIKDPVTLIELCKERGF